MSSGEKPLKASSSKLILFRCMSGSASAHPSDWAILILENNWEIGNGKGQKLKLEDIFWIGRMGEVSTWALYNSLDSPKAYFSILAVRHTLSSRSLSAGFLHGGYVCAYGCG